MSTVHKPIAHGRTADIHSWDDQHVLKLFHTWFELEDIEYEQKIARAVHASGVKSPAVGEIVRVDGRNGLIYERVAGESMLAHLLRRPWNVFRYAHAFAQLHAHMHNHSFEVDIPAQRTRLQNKVSQARALPASLKKSLLEKMHQLPDGNRVCHGDFHPDNILISHAHTTVIDWIDASRGNPLADVARTSVILLGVAGSTQARSPWMKSFVRAFHSKYLDQYFRLRPGGREEYCQWLPIVAGARLSENIPELEEWLMEQAAKG